MSGARQTISRASTVAALAVLLGATLGMPLPAPAAQPPPPAVVSNHALDGAPSITLITGDVVTVRELPDGRLVVAVRPAGDEPTQLIDFIDEVGDLHLTPAWLLPLIPERLDPRLFNISALLRDGYGANGRGLPLVITYAGAPVSLPGTSIRRELPSIGGVAVTLEATGLAQLRGPVVDSALAGVEKIWLDGPMSAALDESVPQIGAPAAWQQGYDGTGVTIAIVDTGIDDSHDDLAGRVVAAEVFSDSPSSNDLYGHGTHVASIAAGTGAASDGRYSGVAYGAELVNAKVLDDYGSGLESWVIAGMEWAAIDQDADVINLSLTGGPSDGTDPVSLAVNALTADEGALFVTAAGNRGGRPESVEAPATADAALAVGAVDKSDQLTDFTAWGPRLDGTGVKPEIVGPGESITAARADGSEIGQPVGEDYMELSGTSMSAPHVAGAAALLLDAHPTWSWAQLKSALVTSAADVGATVFQQGGGRVDVAAALAQTVHADVATIDLGPLEYPHDDGETSEVDVTLTNRADDGVTLDLAAAAVNAEGQVAPPQMIKVDPVVVELAAGASETVTVTFDPQTGPIGLFGGTLTATERGTEVLHVPLSFLKEPELVDLTIEVIEREGMSAMAGGVYVQDVNDTAAFLELYEVFTGAQTVRTRVVPGTYAVSLLSVQADGSGGDLVTVVEPELEIAGATELTLDSNETNVVEIEVVDDDLAATEVRAVVYRASEAGPDLVAGIVSFDNESVAVYANQTEPVSLGAFEFVSRWTMLGERRLYDLIFPEIGAIPASLSYEVGRDDVAEITDEFHADVPRGYLNGRASFRPWEPNSVVYPELIDVPVQRLDWVTADDTEWSELIDIGYPDASAPIFEVPTAYVPGEERHHSWVESPVRPWAPTDRLPTRSGDLLTIDLPSWSDQQNNFGLDLIPFFEDDPDTYRLAVTADGDLLGESDLPYGEFLLPADPADVEVTLDVSRDAPWWTHSTQTSTTWRFVSEPAGEVPVAQALFQVDYDVDLDLANGTDAPNMIEFRAYDPTGNVPAAFRAEWSIDDGATWHPLRLTDLGNGVYESTVPVPAACDPECFVSLRVAADDETGTVLEQEVQRAYTARYVAVPPTTEPPTTEPPTTPVPTTTLPPTGGGNAASLAALALGVGLVGGLAVAAARRRLRAEV